jgi:hypothetical protein
MQLPAALLALAVIPSAILAAPVIEEYPPTEAYTPIADPQPLV